MLIPQFIFWKFKVHNGVTAVLDFHQRLADKLLLKFKVVTSLDKYLPLIFKASDSTEIWKGSVWPRKDDFKSTTSLVKKEPRLNSASRSLCCCCFLMSMSSPLCLQPRFSQSLKACFHPSYRVCHRFSTCHQSSPLLCPPRGVPIPWPDAFGGSLY